MSPSSKPEPAASVENDVLSYRLRRRNQKRSEEVARSIIRDIVRNNVPPGTLLDVEAVMIADHGVGRPTMREALRILEVQGILSLKPGVRGGPVVEAAFAEDFAGMASLHFQARRVTLRDLMEVRLLLEPLIAEQAAIHGRGGDADLEAILDRERMAVAGEDSGAHPPGRMAEEFHPRVAALSGNPALGLMSDCANILCIRLVSYDPEELGRVHDQHRGIARAIARGNAKMAGDRMRQHMQEFTEYTAQKFPQLMNSQIEWE